MAYLIKPDPAYCREIGVPDLGHIPGIWSGDWVPSFVTIDYLIAKGTGRWVSVKSEKEVRSEFGDSRPLPENTMLAIGYDLANFIDYCERTGLDWRTVSYKELLRFYQKDMETGKWAWINKGHPLSPATINRRVTTAADFLTYAAASGHRGSFRVQYRSVPSHLDERGLVRVPQREGKVRQHPKSLRLPTLIEIEVWLNDLRARYGITIYLMAKTAIQVGLRAEEILLLRVSQLPKIPTNTNLQVSMTICFGTKGERTPNDPTKKGKERDVQVPVSLLKEWYSYISAHRKLCLSRFRLNNPGVPQPEELFLSKYTGKRFGYYRFYEVWKASASLPFKEFSPHLARHTWACYTLLEKLQLHSVTISNSEATLATLADKLHETLIDIYISPQLGHIDRRTTAMYLQWLINQCDLQSPCEHWWDYLNG